MFRSTLVVVAAMAVFGCSRQDAPLVAASRAAVVVNGGFEADAIDAGPSGWIVEKYLNDRISPLALGAATNNLGLLVVPPTTVADLNLTPDAGGKDTWVVGAASAEVQPDPDLGAVASFRYPKFGIRSGVVNAGGANVTPADATPTGRNNSGNSMKQTMTLGAGDVDPIDGQIHLRFVAAPVLQNPGHTDYEQPYFFIQVRNVTRNTVLYSNFNFAGQAGVAWKQVGTGNAAINYTDWQLIDVAPGTSAVVGEQVELIVFAVGCSRGGHWGRVYVDAFGSAIPGLYLTGSAPTSSRNNTTLTYTLSYRNGSATAAAATQTVFNTPPGTTFASTTGSSCTTPAAGIAGAVTCTIGALAAGASGSFTVTVNVPSSVTGLLTAQDYWISATGITTLIGSKIDTIIYNGPATLSVVSGTPQNANLNTAFGQDLVVRVRDASNNNLSNIRVDFAVPASGASASLPLGFGITDASGLARVSPSANGTAGTYNVTASASGIVTTGTFVLTNNAGAPASVSVVSGGSQSTTVGTAFAAPLIVVVRDAQNNLVPNATVTFTVPASGASAAVTVTATTNASGQASVPATANSTAGSYAVTAAVAGVATPASFALTNTAGAPASVSVVSGGTQSTTVGTAFAAPLVVVVRDAQNNPVPNTTVTFTVPGSGASAAVTVTATTNASGQVSVPATANSTAGSYSVTASVSGVGTPASFSLTNTAGTPASVSAVSGGSQSTTVGTAFAAPLIVVVRDAQNNPVPNTTVTFTVPGSGASAAVTVTATTNASGQVSVSATANAIAGSYSVTASVSGVGTPATFALANTPGAPASVSAVSGGSQSAAVGTAFAQPLVVVVRDALGNPVANTTVTFTVPGSGASAAVTVTATTNASGQVSVPATANSTAGSYSVTASVNGVATPASFSLTNTASVPTSVSVVSGGSQSTVVGTAFAAPLVMVVRDAQNNPVSNATVTFTVPGSGASATVAVTASTNASGQVSVPATANATAGSYSVTASVSGVSTPATFSLTNTAGPATSVSVVSGGSQSTAVGSAFAAPLVVVVRDAQNNPVPNATVTFTVPSSGASAAVAVTATTDANGQVSVPATANATAGSYSVTASMSGVTTPATFSLINLSIAPTALTLESGDAQSTQVTTAYAQPLVFSVKDAQGNAVSAVRVDFSVPSTGASVSLSATSLTSDAQGRVSLTATANTVAGAVAVRATVSGLAPVSANLSNLPGVAVAVHVVSGGSQSAPTGTAFPSSLVVEAVDAWGNPVPGATITWSSQATGAGATLDFTSVITDSNGRASVQATANTTGGSYPVTARLPGGQQVDFVLTNIAAAEVTITASSGTPQSSTVATAFTAPLVVLVQRSGAPLANAAVTFLVPSQGASASLSATTALTDAQGHAQVSATANSRAGSYGISATTAGAAQPASFALTNAAGAPVALIPNPGSSPQTAQSGTDFATPLSVQLVDRFGNPVPNVTVTFTAPGSGATATLSSTTVSTDANGNAVISSTAGSTPGTYEVTVSAPGVTTPVVFTLTNSATAPVLVTVMSGSPQSTRVTTAFPQSLQVKVTRNGAPVANAQVAWVVPTSGATATISSSSTTTDAAGLSQIDATATQRAGRYEVLATVVDGSGPGRFVLTNTAGDAASVSVLASSTPQSTRVLTAFPLPLLVTVKDAFSNPVPGAALTFTAPTSEPTATLTASPPTTDVDGQAFVTAIAATKAGSYQVTATVSGVATPAQFELTNLAGDPSVISVLSGADQSTLATTAFPAPLSLEVRDAQGNAVAGAVVTLTLPTSGPSATAMSLSTDQQGHASTQLVANEVPGVFDARLTAPTVATPVLAHFTITPIPTSTVVELSSATPTIDAPPSFIATVTGQPGTPSGTVRFLVDDVEVGTAELINGRAELAAVSLELGAHAVEAVYDAQGAFAASLSAASPFELGADAGSLNGGGGCNCQSPGGGTSWLLIVFGLVLFSARRRMSKGLLVVPLLMAGSAGAQEVAAPGVSLRTFHPAPAGSDWFSSDSLDLRGHLRPSVRVLFDYGHNPLVVYNANGSIRSVAIANQAWLDFGVSLTLWDRVRVNVALPAVLHSGSFPATFNGVSLRPTNEWGLGDVSLGADVRLVGSYGTPFTLALGAVMTAPTGASDAFFGDGRFGVTPRLSAAGEHKLFLYAAQVGYAFRGGTLAGVAFHDELRFTASAGFRFFDRKLLVGPEVHGFVDFAGLASGRPVGLEADLGAHYQVHPDVRLSAGGGAGLIRSPGVPDFRVLASVTWAPHVDPAPVDRDGDGIADELDACPDVPRGPTPDALKPGCPELDADHDGVLDDADACPAVARGPFPDPKRAGCPDADSDGDGVRDSKDLCPSVAKGPQPDPKREGCPDGDADGDGVLDAVDDCPSTPAGLFADPARRGCPVADRDGDLVADVVDACPDTAGAPSTNPKKNGCPGLVKVEGGKIKILTPVNFATSKDVILPSSNAVLVAVADVMKSFPEIQHLAIEGHTDSQGKPAANKDLSQRRANSVLRWLVSHGVAAERLEAHGYGQEQPVADNKTDAGRATNRRVVFRIVEKANE